MRIVKIKALNGCRPWADTARAVVDEYGNHNGCLRVVHDPDTECGFSPGAEFTRADVQLMLINHSFTLGTIIYHPSHGNMPVVEYAYAVQRGPRITMRYVQALKGNTFFLIPGVLGKSCGSLVRIGMTGCTRPQRIK